MARQGPCATSRTESKWVSLSGRYSPVQAHIARTNSAPCLRAITIKTKALHRWTQLTDPPPCLWLLIYSAYIYDPHWPTSLLLQSEEHWRFGSGMSAFLRRFALGLSAAGTATQLRLSCFYFLEELWCTPALTYFLFNRPIAVAAS
jgi:hypothetical protein